MTTTARPSPARRQRSRRSAPTVASAAAMSEAQLQDAVVELMRLAGFTSIYHTHDSRRSEPGFPDVVAVNPRAGRVVFCEFKGERPGARVSEAQRTWLYALAQCPGVETYLFVPQDWRDGHVERVLLLGSGDSAKTRAPKTARFPDHRDTSRETRAYLAKSEKQSGQRSPVCG